MAQASLPTRHGPFRIHAFPDAQGREHAALVCGQVAGAEGVPVRVHSECLTGDAFGSLRCDCRGQLEASLAFVQGSGRGVILYLRQEGRGIGLGNKIRAYALQEAGLDTHQANEALGFRPDEREYTMAAAMLRALGPASIRLLSNNPGKMQQLRQHGIRVVGRVPVLTQPHARNEGYLRAKLASGHLLHEAFGLAGPLP